MYKKTILKFNSIACLASAFFIFSVLNTTKAATWVDESFSAYNAGETPTIAKSTALISSSTANAFIVDSSGNKKLNFLKALTTTANTGTYYKLADTFSTDRPQGYFSFKISQGTGGTANAYFNVGLGTADAGTMAASVTQYIALRFYLAASSNFRIYSGNGTAAGNPVQQGSSYTIPTSEVAVQVWYNKTGSSMSYTNPSGVSKTLNAGKFVVYVNGAVCGVETGDGSGGIPAQAVSTGTTLVSTIGKLGFIGGSSSSTHDFIVDDIYAADSAPAVSVPFAISSATTATVQAGSSFSYPITTSGGTATSYEATGLPSYLSINTATGVISGTVPASTPATTTPITIGLSATGASTVTANLALTVTAAPIYGWNNTGTAWTNAASWTNNAVPANSASTDTAAFGNLGGSATSVDVGTGRSIGGIVFNSGAYAYTWTGTDITVGFTGGITNNAAAIQTFNNKVINSSGNATWSSVSGGSLVFSGGIDLTQATSSASRTLTFAGAGNFTVSGAIANGGTATNGAVTVTNTGTTILSGNNTYGGLTTMNAAGGTLTLSGNNSGAAGGVTLTAGALNINNNNALGSGPISFAAGTTINNTSGTAVVNAGNQAWTWTDLLTFGASTNTAANNLNLGAGTATVSSSRTITLAGTGTKLTMGPVNITSASTGRTLTGNGAGNTLEMGGLTLSANTSNAVVVDLLGSANLNVTGPIVNGSAFAHGVNVGATGTNTFSGANTYTGTTKVSGNTLILSGTSASSGYILAGATTNVVLKVNAVNALNSSATLLGSSSSSTAGTLEFAAAGDYALNQYLGQNMNFSNSSGSAATLTFTNASNILGTATSGKTFANKSTNLTITFNGEVDISGAENATNTISTLGPVVISNRVFNSNTSFTRSLLKLETNSLTMYGVNSYNGTTIVSKGALNIPTGGSLTSCGDTIVKGSGTSVGNSASLNLAGSAGVVQVSTNGFVRGYTSGSTTTRGTISSLQVQEAGAVEVAVGTTWTTGGTIVFGTGSKVSVTGTPVSGDGPYTLMTASAAITGSPALVGAAGWALRVDGPNLLLEEIDIYNIGVGVTTTFSDIITGTVPLVKKGLGTAIITGDNTFSGGTVLQAGTLQVGHVNGLGTGAVTLTSGTLKSTVDLDLARLNPNTSTVGTGNPTYQETYGSLSLLKYSGNTTTINGAVTLDVASGTTMTMLTLVGNSNTGNLVTKIGAGTVKLMGGTSTTVLGGWRIEEGTVWFTPSSNNGGGTGPITLAGGIAKFSKLQNSNGTFTGYEVPSDLTVESNGVIQYDPSPLTLLGQNNLGFNNLNIGANTLEVATATTSTVAGQGLPSVNFKSATLTGNATLKNPANLDLNLQAVSGTSGFIKTGLGTLYLSDQPNQAAAFAKLTSGMTVESITVEYAGSGYAVAPEVTLVGGGGTGTTATATIDNKGRVTSIAVITAGSGYTSLPRVVIAAPPTVATASSYTGATTVQEGKLNLNGSYVSSVTVKSGAALELTWLAPAQARCSIDAISSGTTGYLVNAANAYVKDLYLTKAVGGYAPNSTLNLTIAAPAKVDGTGPVLGGVAATATATVNSDGVISALNIVNGGSGYVIAPMVTIPAPTVPTVVASTTGSITFESGAKLALNIDSPTSASYTLITADGGIVGTPSLETAISGYALTKSIDGKSLLLEVVKTTPTITITPYLGYTYTGSIQGPGVNEVNKGGSAGGVTLSYMGTGSTTYGPSDIPPINAGAYTLTATVASDSSYNEASSTPTAFTIARADQTITGLAATDDSKTYGGIYMDFDLTVTKGASTSALSYSSSNTGVATIHPTTGSVHIVGAGTTTLTVNQAADANYNAATAVTQILTVGKADQTITGLAATDSKTFGAADYTLAVTKGASSSALSFASSATGVATVNPTTGLVHVVGAGTTTLTVNQAGDANYNAATAVTQTLTVTQSGTTFASWSGNAALTSDLVYKYAFGAADKNSAAQKMTSGTTASTLSLTAVVRTDDLTHLVIIPKSVSSLSGAWNATDPVISVVNAADQTGLGTGLVRKVYTVDRGTDSKRFLKLEAVYTQ